MNEYAKSTAPTTNLLDRFFMIVLDISLEVYVQKNVNIEELDDIFVEYFRIFIKNPEKGSMEKVLKFMKNEEKTFKLK